MKTKNLLYILPLAALVACEPDIDEVNFTNGSADFSKTVAVGNSLTAGYQSGALSLDGQLNSLPAMVMEQMKAVGGGEFKQPLLSGDQATLGIGVDPAIAASGRVQSRLALKGTVDCTGAVSLGPVRLTDPYLAPLFLQGQASVAAEGPFNNQGVPGAKLTDLTNPGYINPFFFRLKTSQQSTMLSLATDLQATFFMLWIGNNDVLGYATEGGDESPTGATLTDATTFDTTYNVAVNALITSGAKSGVVANIPDVTSIPYFTTVPIGTNITEDQANQLNAAYAGYNGGLNNAVAVSLITQAEADERNISFRAGVNTFVVTDPSLTDLSGLGLPSIRQIKSGELLTLTTPGDSLKCAGWGTRTPIPGVYHLRADEIKRIADATTAYNATIKTAAQANGLAFVDANARLKQLSTTGITEDGINFSSALVTGGAFSLDGVHPTTRGYAIIANDFISAINSRYSSNIPKVNVGSFSTVEVEQ